MAARMHRALGDRRPAVPDRSSQVTGDPSVGCPQNADYATVSQWPTCRRISSTIPGYAPIAGGSRRSRSGARSTQYLVSHTGGEGRVLPSSTFGIATSPDDLVRPSGMSFDDAAVQHAYEDLADGYAGRFGSDLEDGGVDDAVLNGAVNLLVPSALVLDLGCGPGQVASAVKRRGCHAVGVDLTSAMLDVARQRNPHLPLINGNVLRLPVRDGAFDGVIAWFSLHNLPRPLLSQALSEIRRVLRRGGVFVMVTHAGAGEDIIEHDRNGRTEQVLITYYEPNQLRSVLGRHRFRIVDLRERDPLEHEHAVTKLLVTAVAE